jgi:uncharacterized protein
MAYLKSRPVWIQLLLFLGMAAGLAMIFSFIGVIILSQITGLSFTAMTDQSQWNLADDRYITIVRGLQIAQFVGLFLVPVLLFAYFSDPKPYEYLGLKKPYKPGYYFFGILIMVAAIPLSGLLGYINKEIPLPVSWTSWMKEKEAEALLSTKLLLAKHTIKDLLINFVVIALLAGVGEELLFRGVLQRLFIRWFKSPWAGILITAAIFSGIHMQFYGFFPRFALGILLGAIYWYSGSLWAAILAHFFYDAFVVLMLYLNPEAIGKDTIGNESLTGLWVMGLISGAAVVAILWWMKKNSQTSFATVYKNEHKDHSNPFEV